MGFQGVAKDWDEKTLICRVMVTQKLQQTSNTQSQGCKLPTLEV